MPPPLHDGGIKTWPPGPGVQSCTAIIILYCDNGKFNGIKSMARHCISPCQQHCISLHTSNSKCVPLVLIHRAITYEFQDSSSKSLGVVGQ